MLKLLEMSQIVNGKNIRNEHDNEIAGHRRYEAVKRLGLPHIECNVFEDMSER